MRVILVPVADRPECAKALKFAFDLGERLGANLVGCHIREHARSTVSVPAVLGIVSSVDAEWEQVWKGKKTQKSHVSAQALFAKIAAQNNYPAINRPRSEPGAMWLEKVGAPSKVLSILGPVSDLLVVSRPSAKGGELAKIFMQAALMDSSRPVLVLPQSGNKTIGQRISIAWNQSAEAAAAVSAAMPLLQLADEVNIISCGPENALGPKSSHLVNYLKFWGIKPKSIRLRGADGAKTIHNSFRETKSDLLVMGAYSRSRLRERVFGGVTDYMLNRANIPVLMLHR